MEDTPEPIKTNSDLQQAIHRLYEGLENKDFFTVEEASSLTLRSPTAIRQAAQRGELKGLIVDHHVICIPRQALLEWLQTRPKL